MFTRPDNTYNDIREKSLMQWLDEMEQHSDVAVRGGVKLTREYVQHLQEEIRRLEEENQLKAQYLKKNEREKLQVWDYRKALNQKIKNIIKFRQEIRNRIFCRFLSTGW